MRLSRLFAFFRNYSLEKGLPFLRENGKLIAQFILTVLFMGLGIWFLKHEKAELSEVKSTLVYAQWTWVVLGIGVTAFYLLLQAYMYLSAFYSIQCKVRLTDMVVLFLKRNLISVFLPAGGVSSLVFFTGPLEKKGISKTQIHYASTLYGFVGILTVILVAIPALIYAPQAPANGLRWQPC
jgi:phosphatidylglycerol lysyltransferase